MIGYVRIQWEQKLGRAKPAPLGDGWAVFSPLELTATPAGPDDVWPYRTRVRLEVEEGQAVVTTVEVSRVEGGPPVSSANLHRVPIQGMIQGAGFSGLFVPGLVLRHRGGNRWEGANLADDLEGAVAAYKIALACGIRRPIQVVAEVLGIPESTARGRIAMARDKGDLSKNPGRGKARS